MESLRDKTEEVLKTVFDPEIPVNIWDLGLVYELQVEEAEGKVKIIMTLTAPACPVAGDIIAEVQQKAEAIEGVKYTLPSLSAACSHTFD